MTSAESLVAVALILVGLVEVLRGRAQPGREPKGGYAIGVLVVLVHAYFVRQAFALPGRHDMWNRDRLLWGACAAFAWAATFCLAAWAPHLSVVLRLLRGAALPLAAASFAIGLIALILAFA